MNGKIMRNILGALFCIVTLETSLGYSVGQSRILKKDSALLKTKRRSFFKLVCSSLLTGTVLNPLVASASYGDSSNMEMPSYIEFLIERNKNVDPSSFLYKGADPEVLLNRLLIADKKLAEIPQLASEKKWSQVQGILTGPLGSLGETLNLIAKSALSPEVQAAGKKVKADVFAIGSAATKKDAAGCTSGAKLASQDLAAFARLSLQ